MNKVVLSLVISLAASFSGSAVADIAGMRQVLAEKYPATKFKSIDETPVPGVYQVVMGKNVAYTFEDGRYFMFGSLFDMQTQTDLTASKREQANKIDISDIPLVNAIKTVKGKGTRKLIVFTDPDCPYCKILGKTLDTMDDITVYNMLFPIASLHPGATRKSENIFCSADSGKVLDDWFVRSTPIKTSKPCKNPVAENVALAAKLGLYGTPMVISFDGRLMSGAGSKAKIEEFLAVREITSLDANK